MSKDLNKLSTEKLGRLFPVMISEYNPVWKDMFIAEKEIILSIIGSNTIFSIEHIGSTAIPGLCAKPTIDILIEIEDDTDKQMIIDKLKVNDYFFIPKPENPPSHMMFAKGYSEEGYIGQTYHLHVRYKGDWDEPLFRNYLISHPAIAGEYSELKLKLAALYQNDREKYTSAKTEFISRVIMAARTL